MKNIEISIYTTKHIGTDKIAQYVLGQLEEIGLPLQKIGLYEPLKEGYSLDKAIDMWAKEKKCYDEEEEWTAGGFLGKSKSPSYQLMVSWWKYPSRVDLNYLTFFFPVKTFDRYREEIVSLFKEIVSITDAIYGYISHSTILGRQHTTGTLRERMPGVFWCNYFGQLYVDFFERARILSFPWEMVETLPNGGIITFLTKDPHIELLKSDELEKKAKKHLGWDSFGDPEEMEVFETSQNTEDWTKTIKKNVPEIK